MGRILALARKLTGPLRRAIAFLMIALLSLPAHAWGDKGHRMVNRAAWQHLPAELPGFLRAAAVGAEIEYLGPEPDRWRDARDSELNAAQAPEHYINLEDADRIGPLPRERWQFVRNVYAYRAAHPEQTEMQPEKIGLLPWEITEVEQRLEAAFREWRSAQAERRDPAPAEATIIFYMGWLGHYAADGSQPLHTTVRYNGWVGPNPRGYTTERKIHAQFETEFVNANVSGAEVARYARSAAPAADVFAGGMAFIRESNSQAERVYQLEKAGAWAGQGTQESRRFVAQRLAAAATLLDSLWLTAWRDSAKPPSRASKD